jgi:MFS family permease
MCGIYAGQLCGGAGGYVAQTSSWRNAFLWFGATGVVYAVALFFLLKDGRRVSADAKSVPEHVSAANALRALLGTEGFLKLAAYFTLPSISGWAIKNWLPTYLASEFNLRQGPAGISATGYVTLASFAGALLGGMLADRAMHGMPRGRIYVSAFGMALCAPALIGLGNAGSLGMAIICMILFGVGFGFFDANNMPILCQIIRPEYRATGYGVMNMVSIACGAGITVAMGAMRDRGVGLGVAFSICAAITLLAGWLILQVRPRESQES